MMKTQLSKHRKGMDGEKKKMEQTHNKFTETSGIVHTKTLKTYHLLREGGHRCWQA